MYFPSYIIHSHKFPLWNFPLPANPYTPSLSTYLEQDTRGTLQCSEQSWQHGGSVLSSWQHGGSVLSSWQHGGSVLCSARNTLILQCFDAVRWKGIWAVRSSETIIPETYILVPAYNGLRLVTHSQDSCTRNLHVCRSFLYKLFFWYKFVAPNTTRLYWTCMHVIKTERSDWSAV